MKLLSGCSKNKNNELPQRFLSSKQCPDGTEDYDPKLYHSDAFHGFICEDTMCFKVKVATIYNRASNLRMILRGFIYYVKYEGSKSGSEIEYADTKGKKKSVGHYVTFIYLNDNQWLILDENNHHIVPAGYAFYFAERGNIFAFENKSLDPRDEEKVDLNSYYRNKMKDLYSRLN